MMAKIFEKNTAEADPRAGFTLLELLVFAAIFALVSIGLIAVLTTFTTLRVREQANAEVNQQSVLLLQTIQGYVQQASLIQMGTTASTSLELRMATSSIDPTYIEQIGNAIYVQQGTGGPQQLNSNEVNVSDVNFVKQAHQPGGHDSVNVSFTLTYNGSNALQQYAQGFSTSIARVNAATFDSNIIPASNGIYSIGVSTSTWTSIDGILYFSGSNVGIGVASPAQTLTINGGMQLNTATSQPSCNSANDGTFWVVRGGSGVKDNVQVCVENASSSYSWFSIY